MKDSVKETDPGLCGGVLQDSSRRRLGHTVAHYSRSKHPRQVVLVHLTMRTPHNPVLKEYIKEIYVFKDPV